jgi:hypothetical protein
MSEEQIKALREAIKNRLGDEIVILGLLEHQIDTSAKIIDMLATEIEASGITLSTELKDLLQMQKDFLQVSSVDFDNLQDQFQSYKIPKAIQQKSETRKAQNMYLQRQIDAGLFGNTE